MKKLFIIITLGVFMKGHQASAQITLDRQIDSSAYGLLWRMVQISPTETKYFFADTLNQSFSLYNMDFSPFITNIPVPDPFAFTSPLHFEVYYITRALFDCDTSNIEYVFAAPQNGHKPFRIYRTDGTLLFQRDSSFAPYCYGDCGNGGSDGLPPIISTSAGAKLVLTSYTSGNEQDFVYSLCGTLPSDVFDFATMPNSYVRIFPNPTSGQLTFQINLPDNMNEYELVILDSNGREVRRGKTRDLNRNYSIDVRDFSSGTYFYTLCTKSKSYQSGKFIFK
jgi:hypothetical protein